MSHGFKVNNSDGSEKINITDRLTAFFTSLTYSWGAQGTYTFTIAGLNSTNFFAFTEKFQSAVITTDTITVTTFEAQSPAVTDTIVVFRS